MKRLIILLFTLITSVTPLRAAFDNGQVVAATSVSEQALLNGRVYDPQTGRFLSADIVVQDPNNLQSYNRYSYCLNNPLGYTDPSGYNPMAMGMMSGFTNDRLRDQLGTQKAEQVIATNQAIDAAVGDVSTNIIINATPILGDAVGFVQDSFTLADSSASTGDRLLATGSIGLTLIDPTNSAKTARSFNRALGRIEDATHAMDAASDSVRAAGHTLDAANLRRLDGVDVAADQHMLQGALPEAAPTSGGIDGKTYEMPAGYPGASMDGMHADHAVPQALDPNNPAIQSEANLQAMPAAMNSVDKSRGDAELAQRYNDLVTSLQNNAGMSPEDARKTAYNVMEQEINAHANSVPALPMDPMKIDELKEK